MQEIKTLIDNHCRSNGIDLHRGMDELLDYLINFFDCSKCLDFENHVKAMRDSSEYLFKVAIDWLSRVSESLEKGSWLDYFGDLYESQYYSRSKSSSMGQFFTPKSVSSLLGSIVGNENGGWVNDCACGSGRLLLAHFAQSEDKDSYYIGEDLDTVSVKMCALNMMAHGMRGRVVRHDTLREPVAFDYGFEINEVRYPIPNTMYSIRKINNIKNRKL